MGSTYSEKLKDPRWQRRRLEVMQRDGFACRDCLASDKTLNVHHCHYQGREPWDVEVGLLLTLCEECHGRRGDLEADARLALGRIMARMSCEHSEDQLAVFCNELIRAAGDESINPTVMDHDVVCDMHALAVLGQKTFSSNQV